jgi:hypothetical protein
MTPEHLAYVARCRQHEGQIGVYRRVLRGAENAVARAKEQLEREENELLKLKTLHEAGLV